jgi:16S rRNA (uracil1498-N3)-methyltransferase
MTERYFVETPIAGDRAVLADGEAHHLIHVMRGRPGDRVTLFDGSGAEYAAEVVVTRRDEVELTIVGRDEVDRELGFALSLAAALPKGDRQRWLVEKSVELGVTCLIPLVTARSVARPEGGAAARMRRWVIDASKQCGRNRLMEIAEPVAWAELLAESVDLPVRLLAHPSSDRTATVRKRNEPESLMDRSLTVAARFAVLAAIGPEGGFTDDEVAAATRAGWQPVDLGPRILRVETAAIFVAAMLTTRSAGG